MVIIGALLLVMVISSTVVVSACMLSSRRGLELEPGDGAKVDMNRWWSGTSFGGRYATPVPQCSFEPEDLEDIRSVNYS